MDAEYIRWKEEQKRREAAGRAVQTPASPAQTITSSVTVPALQAGLVGIAIAILFGGLALLFGATWLLAGKVALGGLLVGTSGATIYFVGQERAIHSTASVAFACSSALSRPHSHARPFIRTILPSARTTINPMSIAITIDTRVNP